MDERISYCNQHLKFIGEGSGRMVFEMNDGEFVLKLAKNEKGLQQNAVELSTDEFDILAQCEYYERKVGYVFFIIMERAIPVNEASFENLTDINFQLFNKLFHDANGNRDNFIDLLYDVGFDQVNTNKSQRFSEELEEYINANNINAIGDLRMLENWGQVDRHGVDTIVLVDYGMDDKTFTTMYK